MQKYGETMKFNAQMWASVFENVDQTKLLKMSVVKMKSELDYLMFHSCSLFSTAAPSCTDIF